MKGDPRGWGVGTALGKVLFKALSKFRQNVQESEECGNVRGYVCMWQREMHRDGDWEKGEGNRKRTGHLTFPKQSTGVGGSHSASTTRSLQANPVAQATSVLRRGADSSFESTDRLQDVLRRPTVDAVHTLRLESTPATRKTAPSYPTGASTRTRRNASPPPRHPRVVVSAWEPTGNKVPVAPESLLFKWTRTNIWS